MLLYERFLGRPPFAGHRDSVSDLIGDSLESAIEDVLTKAGISFRKTKRAERIEGFDQVPDFTPVLQKSETFRDKASRVTL